MHWGVNGLKGKIWELTTHFQSRSILNTLKRVQSSKTQLLGTKNYWLYYVHGTSGKKKKKTHNTSLKVLLVLRAGWKFPLSVLSFLGEGSHKVVHFFFFLEGVKRLGGGWGTENVQLIWQSQCSQQAKHQEARDHTQTTDFKLPFCTADNGTAKTRLGASSHYRQIPLQ